jgi:Zn-dependent M28 family amino/carboxypeptidase
MRLATAIPLFLLVLALLLAALYWLIAQPFVSPHRSRPLAADAARLEVHVRALSEHFYPRSFDRPEHLEQVADYIRSALDRAGGRVTEQTFPVEEAQYRNVIARYGAENGPLLVIGAHYDSYADLMSASVVPTHPSPQTHTPGADDNASGIAGLLELARLLGQDPPARSVELVAYCLEEPPHFRTDAMGSAWHARDLRKRGRAVQLMLALEMIGYFDSRRGSQTYPLAPLSWIYPDRGDFIAVVGRMQDWPATRRIKALMSGATDLPVRSINAPSIIPGVDFSDHSNYWDEGFPALMITDTAFYRNPYYHDAEDTADRLDYARMAKVVQAIYAVTQSALSPPPPSPLRPGARGEMR